MPKNNPVVGVAADLLKKWHKTMIDAVGSLVLNTPHLRGSTEQVASERSYAANPERIQEIPRAPYISPYVYVDVYFDKAVLQIRDSDTGDVLTQFPAENQLEQARLQAARARNTPEPETDTTQVAAPAESGNRERPKVAVVPSAKTPAPTPQQIEAFSAGAQTAASGASAGSQVSVEA